MEFPVLENFCCVFSLKVGCIFMGILNMFLNTIVAILLTVFAMEINEGVYNGKNPDELISVVYPMLLFLIALLITKFLMDILFVIIVIKGQRQVIPRFFVLWTVFLALFSVGFMKTMSHLAPALVLVKVIFICQNFFYMLVVRSYLLNIEEE